MNTKQSSRPIRVAMVHYRDDATAGGSLRVGETIANNLDPNLVSAEFVFAYGKPGPVSQHANVPSHFIQAKGPKDFRAWTRARHLFSRLEPDIIHFQEGVVWLRTALARISSRKVVHIHGRYSTFHFEQTTAQRMRSALDARVLQSYLRFTDAQICVNHAARNWLLGLGWISAEKSCVVYNAIDAKRLGRLPPSAEAREKLGLSGDALLLGMVCRLVPEKGCSDFLSIIERLPARWQGVICGDGPLKNDLQRECERRGLVNRIHFLGSLDDVRPVYAALDAYAFVSRYDAFGLTAAESMAAGLPVFGIEREGDYNERQYPLFPPDHEWLTKCASDDDIESAVEQTVRRISKFGEQPRLFADSIARAQSWVASRFAAPLQAQAMTRVYQDIYRQGFPSQEFHDQFYGSPAAVVAPTNQRGEVEVIAATA